jgi:hypothetical protein
VKRDVLEQMLKATDGGSSRIQFVDPVEGIKLDADLNNADWTKRTWDLPVKSADELRRYLKSSGRTVDEFKQLPVYRYNVKKLPWLREL